jgi:hypothetical protein
MATAPVRDILFIRRCPALPARTGRAHRSIGIWFDSRGNTVSWAGHEITFFRPGFGTRIRELHPDIIAGVRSGRITDLVDVAGAGALDPCLKRGDLVLSSGDLCIDTLRAVQVQRRDEIQGIVRALAAARKVDFRVGTILTHTRVVGSRKQRLDLFEQTGCSVVQMEHGWFLRSLGRRLDAGSFSDLRVTHLEVVTDAVPGVDRWDHTLAEAWHGILNCSVRRGHCLEDVKRDFLNSWLCGSQDAESISSRALPDL